MRDRRAYFSSIAALALGLSGCVTARMHSDAEFNSVRELMSKRTDILRQAPSHPSGGEGWGEGGVRIPPQLDQYRSEHTIQVVHHVGIGKPKHAKSALFKRSSAGGVVRLSSRMRVAVELDDQTFGARSEVGDVRGKHDLALKLHADSIGSNCGPELSFRGGQVRSKLLGANSCIDVPSQSSPSPCPLPLKGERGSIQHRPTSITQHASVNA